MLTLEKIVPTGFKFVLADVWRKGTIAILDQGIVSLTSFLTGAIIGRTLPQDEFGVFMLVFGIVVLLTNIQAAIISRPYMVFSPRYDSRERAKYSGSTLVHQIIFSLTSSTFIGIGGLLIYVGWKDSEILWSIVAVSVVLSFLLLREYIRQISFAWLKFRPVLIMDCGVALLQISGILILVSIDRLSSPLAFCVMGFACLVISGFSFVRIRKEFSFSFPSVKSDLLSRWEFSKWILAGNLMSRVGWDVFPWSLAAFHGASVCGVFYACSISTSVMAPLIVGTTNIIGPRIAHSIACESSEEMKEQVRRYSVWIVFTFGLIGIVIIIFGGQFVKFVYGSQYGGYGLIVAILALRPLIESAVIPTKAGLLALERTRVVFESYVARGIFNLLVGVPVVWVFGLPGLAVAMVVSVLIGSGYIFASFWFVKDGVP